MCIRDRLSSPSYAEGLICKFTGWNCPVDFKDLVGRKGLYYKKFSDVPFTGTVTGKKQGKIKKGKWDGPYVSYHDNGNLYRKGNRKNGKWEGLWVNYYRNGQLFSEETYKNGKKDGPYVMYHKNGQVMSKGTYKDGKKEGPWVWHKKDGSAVEKYTGTFKNGVKVK